MQHCEADAGVVTSAVVVVGATGATIMSVGVVEEGYRSVGRRCGEVQSMYPARAFCELDASPSGRAGEHLYIVSGAPRLASGRRQARCVRTRLQGEASSSSAASRRHSGLSLSALSLGLALRPIHIVALWFPPSTAGGVGDGLLRCLSNCSFLRARNVTRGVTCLHRACLSFVRACADLLQFRRQFAPSRVLQRGLGERRAEAGPTVWND